MVGRSLVPQLVQRGHQVAGLVRSERSAGLLTEQGAAALVADALDGRSVLTAAMSFRPDAIVNQLTALAGMTDLRHFQAGFAETNRLRTVGTVNLLEAARSSGARRFVSQGYCGWPLARTGSRIKTESDPLDPRPPEAFRETLEALRVMEDSLLGAAFVSGAVLRYGTFYGPGTNFAPGGSFFEDVERRRVPLLGQGDGMFSFSHMADVASATMAAIEGEAVGAFHVVDDDPAPVRDWLPYLAELLGARRPLRVPDWVARWIAPEHLYVLMTSVPGCSNAKFKQAFGWRPQFPSWRDGFRSVVQTPLSITA